MKKIVIPAIGTAIAAGIAFLVARIVKNKKKTEIKEEFIIADFFKKAFHDMKESAKAQHEVDKANL